MNKITISAEITPNPNTLKFVVDAPLLEAGSVDFPTLEKAEESLLAKTLFQIEGVTGVMIGANFVSVTKNNRVDWAAIAEFVTDTIQEVLQKGEPVVNETLRQNLVETSSEEDQAIVIKIKEILDNEIRPAVAMDGGDIRFAGYKDGVVSLYLQGACSACPSSTMTLRMGIENRLREEIPEIKEIVQI